VARRWQCFGVMCIHIMACITSPIIKGT
jgi:hypothetical protein